METSELIKQTVKEKYSDIAKGKTLGCGIGCGCSADVTDISDSYTEIKGYVKDADLNLGCGLPTEFAKIKTGDTVVDLGSGAGNDCFVARHETGETGKVIGIDMTDTMIEKAKLNAAKLKFNNVEFHLGDIENIPLANDVADVVVSNCVFNLVPDKQKAFNETYRILKSGGHFSISDVVTVGELPKGIQDDAELYVGCIGGAIQKVDCMNIIHEAGFKNILIQKEKRIEVPEDILNKYLSTEEKENYFAGTTGIYSITVYAEK